MDDQAEKLRQIIKTLKRQTYEKSEKSGYTRVIAITSGKGGVGKTSFAVNLALALAKDGYRVIILDSDFGFSNIDIMFGMECKYNLAHLIFDDKNIDEVCSVGPMGVKFISGGAGLNDLLNITPKQLDRLIFKLSDIEKIADIVLIDTGAGLSPNTQKMLLAAKEIILITTTEPTAITDAYSIVKVISSISRDARFRLVINKADNPNEAKQLLETFTNVSRDFLNVDIDKLGYLQYDNIVVKSVKQQEPYLLKFPRSALAKQITDISRAITSDSHYVESNYGIADYMRKVLYFFRKN